MARVAVHEPTSDTDEHVESHAKNFFADPLGWVYFSFPWGEKGGPLENEDGPDVWQALILDFIGKQIRAGQNPMEAIGGAIRVAVASGHGVGKTALISWIILWFMSTRAAPQIVVTANTTAQLTNKTWRELSKWQKLAANGDWFVWTATKFYMKGRADDWFASAQPWSAEKAEAFAGTHEKHVLIIFDEASAIEDPIWDSAEGAMTTPGAMWIAFGNPTRNMGRFRECFRKFRKRWARLHVDSRSVQKGYVNHKQIEEWIEDYGEDSDFVRIRVKGQFPRAATNQLISLDVVEAASQRVAMMDTTQPVIMGIDVARFGDDHSVILVRQGQRILSIRKFIGDLDTYQLTHFIVEDIQDYDPDAIFIDVAGGLGAGPADTLRATGYPVIDVNAALRADEDQQYFNKRIEMWWLVREWLVKGMGSLRTDRLVVGNTEKGDRVDFETEEPQLETTFVDQELMDDLTGPEYGFDGKGRKQLEKKEDMVTRGIPSPDCGDALAHTFFMPVQKRANQIGLQERLVMKLKAQQKHSGTSWQSR